MPASLTLLTGLTVSQEGRRCGGANGNYAHDPDHSKACLIKKVKYTFI